MFFLFTNNMVDASQNIISKDLKVVATDGFNIEANLTYPRRKNEKEFSTVVLLHSLGYNSQWWEHLPDLLLERGYAVLKIDLRGHGNSVYNAKLTRNSWKDLNNSGYAKYPDDIVSVFNQIKNEYPKKVFFNNWAIVGADIGASAGVLAVDKMKNYPRTVVMLSPVVKTKGLYIPISIAHLENTDFLSITGSDDFMSKKAEAYLSKFVQNEILSYTSSSKSTGMLMLKNDEELCKIITEWISNYLN